MIMHFVPLELSLTHCGQPQARRATSRCSRSSSTGVASRCCSSAYSLVMRAVHAHKSHADVAGPPDRNCHRGTPTRGADGSVRCDMNLFRTSKDIRPTFGSIVSNLLTVDKFNAAGLTGPG